ncbi:MAG TPA: kelch repeat-containing protein, partial [Acidimicrobiales bacterium]
MPNLRRRLAGVVVLLGLAVAASCDSGGDGDAVDGASDDDSAAPTFERTAAAPLPTARTEVAGAALDGKIFVVGGFLENGAPSPLVDVYDPKTDTWAAGPPFPVAIHHVGIVAARGRVWVAGGF